MVSAVTVATSKFACIVCDSVLFLFTVSNSLMYVDQFDAVLFFKTTLLQGISGIVNVYTYFTMSFDLALSMPCCMSQVAGRDLLVLLSSMLFKHVIQKLLCQYEAIWPATELCKSHTLLVFQHGS